MQRRARGDNGGPLAATERSDGKNPPRPALPPALQAAGKGAMCLNPILLPNGVEVACHHCWQCKKNKVTDWVGRCIAESQTAKAVSVVTLTYGRDEHIDSADHVKAAVLTYSDVQKYLRAYRDYRGEDAPNGYPLRYWLVGEYGTLKARAHWHCVIFWQDKVPDRPLMTRFDDKPFWPHGFSYWDAMAGLGPEALAKTVRYAVKYVAKELESDELQTYVGLSRYPALGHDYFVSLAQRYVEQGLSPQDAFYSFPEVLHKGRPIRFRIQGTSLKTFLSAYNHHWAQAHGDAHQPPSELVEEFNDSVVRAGSAQESRDLIKAEKLGVKNPDIKLFKYVGSVKKPTADDLRSWMTEDRVVWSEKLHHWLYLFEGGQTPWYWSRNSEGVWSWRAKPGGVSDAAKPPIYKPYSRQPGA